MSEKVPVLDYLKQQKAEWAEKERKQFLRREIDRLKSEIATRTLYLEGLNTLLDAMEE